MDSKMRESTEVPAETEALARQVIGAAIAVHREVGPGFLESVYQRAMEVELQFQGIPFKAQSTVRVNYRGIEVGGGRIDLLVDDQLVVELKATNHITDLHRAQTIHYLRATGLPLGILLNFQYSTLKKGIHRVIWTSKK